MEETGFRIWKADDNIDNIDLMCKICKALQESNYAIINISDWNPNVIYELGLAHGLGISTFIVKQENTQIPTDLSGMECIFYSHATELKEKLVKKFSKCKNELKEKLDLLPRIYNLQWQIRSTESKIEIKSNHLRNLTIKSAMPEYSDDAICREIQEVEGQIMELKKQKMEDEDELKSLRLRAEELILYSDCFEKIEAYETETPLSV
jgi:hypothetical protein